MKKVIAITAALLIAACGKTPERSDTVGVQGVFVVDTLFTHEGCTVYRFYDEGRARYFTNCGGVSSTYTTQQGKTQVTNTNDVMGK